jgi:hypothetical protein
MDKSVSNVGEPFVISILRARGIVAVILCGGIGLTAIAAGRSAEQTTAVFTVQTTPALRALGGGLQGVSAVSAADVWSVGTDIVHFNGTTWEAVAKVAGGGTLADVSALNADNAWAAGTLGSAPLAEHWNGKSWSQVATASLNGNTGSFDSILALSATDAWAAGDVLAGGEIIEPLFEHWNGKTWTEVAGARAEGFILKLAGTGPTDVWAVGYTPGLSVSTPLIEHFNGAQWQKVAAPFPGVGAELFSVVALSPTNAWAVGQSSLAEVGNAQQIRESPVQTLIEHWDGQSWQVIASPNIGTPSVFQRNVLYGVAALSASDIWAAGQFQLPDGSDSQLTLALHWDGTAWSISPVPDVGVANGYRGVAVAQPSTVILVGIGAFGGGLPDQSPLISSTSGG